MVFKEFTEDDLRGNDVVTLRRLKAEQEHYRDQAKVLQTKADANVALIEKMIDRRASGRR